MGPFAPIIGLFVIAFSMQNKNSNFYFIVTTPLAS